MEPTQSGAELTIRGTLLGGAITIVFMAANVYLGLKTGMTFSGPLGRTAATVRSDQELLPDAYIAELAAFTDAVRAGTPARVDGTDARAALAIALAAAESVRTGVPVRIADLAQ